MLSSLHLQQFGLIDQQSIDFGAGFTVITGETGAGKSIVLDALAVCLGGRCDAQQVRFGADKADLTASFELSAQGPIRAWLAERELDDQEALHLRRVILAGGRSKSWINGRPASVADLKALGQQLVDLHSQHTQQQLLTPAYARDWLDHAAGLTEQASLVRRLYRQWQGHVQQQTQAQAAHATRTERLDWLQEHLDEMEPLLGQDYQALEQEYDRLSHFEHMMQDCQALLAGLEGHDADSPAQGVIEQLTLLSRRAESQSARAQTLAGVSTQLATALELLQDSVRELRHFVGQQEFDPARHQWLNEQIQEFHRLARKHRVSADQLLHLPPLWQQEQTELDALSDPKALAEQVAAAERAYRLAAQKLDTTRQQHAPRLTAQLREQLQPLSMPEARFEFEFAPASSPSAEGLSQIQLLFSANRGMPLQPLAKIASGGELSRIALVMQVMNATQQYSGVLVFDEVDVGISGRTAEAVGQLLRQLGERLQVISITHQAQVAAQGHHHLLVEKHQGDRARSELHSIQGEVRVQELARMSGGADISATTLAHARELLTSRGVAVQTSTPASVQERGDTAPAAKPSRKSTPRKPRP